MRFVSVAAVSGLLALSASAAACTFSWHHYGKAATLPVIGQELEKVVTDDYCQRYNKTHELFVMTEEYQGSERFLVHVTVGMRKRGTGVVPSPRGAGYQFVDGVVSDVRQREMTAALVSERMQEVMSNLDGYAGRKSTAKPASAKPTALVPAQNKCSPPAGKTQRYSDRCVNGSCTRTFENGCSVQFQAAYCFDPIQQRWDWKPNGC